MVELLNLKDVQRCCMPYSHHFIVSLVHFLFSSAHYFRPTLSSTSSLSSPTFWYVAVTIKTTPNALMAHKSAFSPLDMQAANVAA